MSWKKTELDQDQVKEICRSQQLDPLTASILLRRGITRGKDILFFMEDDLRFLHNPFLFNHMEEAVERVLAAVEEEEHVLIFGDRDVDGITSTTLLYEALENIGISPRWQVPGGEDTYGLSKEIIEQHAREDITLIITVDTGISSDEEILFAEHLGVDVIVLDHHERGLPGTSPALAVINPKVPDSGYPFSGLSGCGVVAKFIWALCFATTDVFNQTMVLINGEREKERIRFSLMKIRNLVPLEQIDLYSSEEDCARTLMEFIQGCPLGAYDTQKQIPLLKELFGARAQIALNSLDKEIAAEFPSLAGRDLAALTLQSRLTRFLGPQSELSTLHSLFTTLFMKRHSSAFEQFHRSLDLTALGTVADLMPLKDENRILVRQGLKAMKKTKREPLREILFQLKIIDQPIGTQEISWQLAPFLNSPGRMGQAELCVQLLLSKDPDERASLIYKISTLNKERKKLGDKLLDTLVPQAKRSMEATGGSLILTGSPKVLRGISGILANRLTKMFNAPAFVLSQQEEVTSGSIRCKGEFSISQYFEAHKDFLLDSGGHKCAAGFSLKTEDLEPFKESTLAFFKDLPPQEPDDDLIIDAEIPSKYLSPDLRDLLDRLSPFGIEFPHLLFLTKSVTVEEAQVMGRNGSDHLKLLIAAENSRWPAVFWNAIDRYKKDFEQGDTVDIVYKMGKNYYRKNETLQLSIMDIKRSQKD